MEASAASPAMTAPRRGHRSPSAVWLLLTADERPHQARASVCRHCARPVPHHHKNEKARAHLLKCAAFRAKMAATSDAERPAWFSFDPEPPRAKRATPEGESAPVKKRKAPAKRKVEMGNSPAVASASRSIPAPAPLPTQQPAQADARASAPLVVSEIQSKPVSIAVPTATRPRPILPIHSLVETTETRSMDDPAVTNQDTVEDSVEMLASQEQLTSSHSGEQDSIHEPLEQKVHDALAMYFYITGALLDSVTEGNFVAAFQIANPGVLLPTPEDLRGALLDRTYHRVRGEMLGDMKLSVNNAVSCNSWWGHESSKAVGERDDSKRVVKYVAMNEAQTLFLGVSRAQSIKWRTANYVANDLVKKADIGQPYICGAVTDCSPTYAEVWRKLKAKYPSKFFQGCISHGLRLMIRDIFKCTQPTTHNLHAEPPTDPLEPLQKLTENCRLVVEWFSRDQELQHKLTVAAVHIEFSAKDREWDQLLVGFRSILSALPALQAIVSEEDFTTSAPVYLRGLRALIKQILHDSGFLSLLEKAVRILEPVNAAMEKFETKDVPCSEVFSCFAKTLPEAFAALGSVVTEDEHARLLLRNHQCFASVYGDGHGIAYLLDPRFIGDGIGTQARKALENIIYSFPVLSGDDDGVAPEDAQLDIAQQLTEYVIEATRERTKKTFRFMLLARGKRSVLQFWLTDGQQWPRLQRLACRVFCLPSSTLRLERLVASLGGSKQALVDTKAELCADKMQFIRINALLTPRLS